MNAYLNMKTATKLVIVFSLMTVMFIFLLVLAQNGLREVQESQRRLAEDYFKPQADMQDFRIGLHSARATLLIATMEENKIPWSEMKKTVLDRESGNKAMLEQLLDHANHDSKLLALLQPLNETWVEYDHVRQQEVIPLLDQQRFSEARLIELGEQAERIERIRMHARGISDYIEQQTTQALDASRVLIDNGRRNIAAGALAAIVLIATLLWLMQRVLSNPLVDLTRCADRIAEGDLELATQKTPRKDEVGALTDAFVRMSRYLNSLAGSAERIAAGDLSAAIQPVSGRDLLGGNFARMAENLRRVITGLHEGVAVLASATKQIIASTGQVASSAQETAAAISEITTTVEEVKQTVTVASQKARHVTETAERTLQVSQEGRQAVGATLDGMNQIREQMQAVAESVVRLSEQCQAVGDMVATVGDLAEQSNLLGVNASIEAVKAGEQGRGFSVVAQEVKSLADQSKQATVQVRGILNEIQKATNKAVLVAEQSTKAVDAGLRQAQQSGDAIHSLAGSIEEFSGAALLIAASSQQQLVGMEQIAMAMENIKKASQDNVTATAQTEQSARSLHQLGSKLKESISTFKISS